MSDAIAIREGYIPFRDWKTWYRLVGDREEPGIAGSDWVIFDESSHGAHAEETKSFCQTLDSFLAHIQAGPSDGKVDASVSLPKGRHRSADRP